MIDVERYDAQDPRKIEGHPIYTLLQENKALECMLEKLETTTQETKSARLFLLQSIMQIDLHYKRKENLYFPYMEGHGITAPPKVMWGVDDEIRRDLKSTIGAVQNDSPEVEELLTNTLQALRDMISKEEDILVPMVMEHFTEAEWGAIAAESDEIGYALIETPPEWRPLPEEVQSTAVEKEIPQGLVQLATGIFTIEQLESVLNYLPIDITFVDENDRVRYFSQSSERIFPRTKAVIGRKVENCHPPQSVHVVEKLLQDFKAGVKDSEDFWLAIQGKMILIRYFAVRAEDGRYLGTLEVTQNIAPLQAIEGEKRLLL